MILSKTYELINNFTNGQSYLCDYNVLFIKLLVHSISKTIDLF